MALLKRKYTIQVCCLPTAKKGNCSHHACHMPRISDLGEMAVTGGHDLSQKLLIFVEKGTYSSQFCPVCPRKKQSSLGSTNVTSSFIFFDTSISLFIYRKVEFQTYNVPALFPPSMSTSLYQCPQGPSHNSLPTVCILMGIFINLVVDV